MSKKKIALFGGTFDPIHLGHATVAGVALDRIGAEKVIFIPAKRSPLKDSYPVASEDDRLKMIALAIDENEKFQVSDYELRKPEPSYTLETVRKFQAECGSQISIHWLIGADTTEELPYWYCIEDLIDECNLTVMLRAGYPTPDFAGFEAIWGPERVKKLQRNIIRTPLIDISSTEIRNRLAKGRSVADMLEPSVANYIYEHNLYQSKPE